MNGSARPAAQKPRMSMVPAADVFYAVGVIFSSPTSGPQCSSPKLLRLALQTRDRDFEEVIVDLPPRQ
jgi:hypothetical protein